MKFDENGDVSAKAVYAFKVEGGEIVGVGVIE